MGLCKILYVYIVIHSAYYVLDITLLKVLTYLIITTTLVEDSIISHKKLRLGRLKNLAHTMNIQ